jgi:hypothetical protein
MEDFLMEVALILYSVFAGAVVIWCRVQRGRPSVNYVAISRAVLVDLMRCRDDLVVVELRRSEKGVIPGALNLPIDQLQGLLRWMPPLTWVSSSGDGKTVRRSS